MKFPIKLLGTRYWKLCLIANMGKVLKVEICFTQLTNWQNTTSICSYCSSATKRCKRWSRVHHKLQTLSLNQIFFPRRLTFHQNPLQVTFRVNEENYLLHFLWILCLAIFMLRPNTGGAMKYCISSQTNTNWAECKNVFSLLKKK